MEVAVITHLYVLLSYKYVTFGAIHTLYLLLPRILCVLSSICMIIYMELIDIQGNILIYKRVVSVLYP